MNLYPSMMFGVPVMRPPMDVVRISTMVDTPFTLDLQCELALLDLARRVDHVSKQVRSHLYSAFDLSYANALLRYTEDCKDLGVPIDWVAIDEMIVTRRWKERHDLAQTTTPPKGR